MGVNIHVKPNDVWRFFHLNKIRLRQEMVLIAENEDTQHFVYLTEDFGLPHFEAYRGAVKLYEEGAISEYDCSETAKEMCIKYLLPVIVKESLPLYKNAAEEAEQTTVEEDPDDDDSMDDEVYRREDELHLAMMDFLLVALNLPEYSSIDDEYGENFADDVLEDFLKYLAEDHLISVYRPTKMLDDETGEEFYIEYPYLDVDEEGSFDENGEFLGEDDGNART